MSRSYALPLVFALSALAAGGGAAGQAAPAAPRYAQALEHELAQLEIVAQCASESAARHHCRAVRSAQAGAGDAVLHAVYSDESDTVYLYLEQLLVVPSDNPRAASALRRLMELNWDLLIGKFEWNARTGEVRLSAVLNTDSNFDRRAFRSTVRALYAVAARHRDELRSLIAQ